MKLDFSKTAGLIPAIIQDARTKNVLMLTQAKQYTIWWGRWVPTGFKHKYPYKKTTS